MPGQRLGHPTDCRDVTVDLLGHRALLFGGAGDLQVHVADDRDRLADPVQGFDRLVDLSGVLLGLAVA
ncbi:hypothetical protein D3C75_1150480 [compost metagenome]